MDSTIYMFHGHGARPYGIVLVESASCERGGCTTTSSEQRQPSKSTTVKRGGCSQVTNITDNSNTSISEASFLPGKHSEVVEALDGIGRFWGKYREGKGSFCTHPHCPSPKLPFSLADIREELELEDVPQAERNDKFEDEGD